MGKVLFIVESSFVGGAEIVFDDYLKCTEFYEQAYLLISKNVTLQNYFRDMSRERVLTSRLLTPLPRYPSYFIKPFVAVLVSFYIILLDRKYRFSSVVSNNSKGIIYLPLVKLLRGRIKVVAHFHDILAKRIISRFFFRLIGNHLVDKFICVSSPVKEALLINGVYLNKLEVVYNGLHFNSQVSPKKLSGNILKFIFIGRIDSVKNPMEYMKFILRCKELKMII